MIDNELVAQIAKAIQVKTGGNVEGKLPEWWAEFIGMVLAELQSAGRLIPAGGRGLEFSEVEALRSAWEELKGYRVDGYARPYINQIVKVAGTLFPATESDEVNGNICTERNSSTLVDEGRESGGQMDGYTCIPAPAEPAEEETKAERDSEGIIRINGGRIVALSCDTREMVQRWFDIAKPGSKWQRDYAAALDLFDREAASSPVVPAPTETEWQTWQEVPEGVWFLTNQNIGCWMRRDGDKVTTVTGGWPVCTDSLVAQAPFVAAEEG